MSNKLLKDNGKLMQRFDEFIPLAFTYNAVTSAPASGGEIRTDNTDLSLVTELFVSNADINSMSTTNIVGPIVIGQRIVIRNTDISTQSAVFEVTALPVLASNSYTIAVTYEDDGLETTITDGFTVGFSIYGIGEATGIFVPTSYIHDIATADADPGLGKQRFNSVTYASITQMFADQFSDNNNDLSQIYNNVLKVNDLIYVQQANDSSKFVLLKISSTIIDASGYFKIPVTFIGEGTGGNIDDAAQVGMIFYRADATIIQNGLVSGVLTGGEVTINADPTKFDLAAGTGIIIDYITPGAPAQTDVTWSQQLAVTVTNIATQDFTSLYMDSAGALQQVGGLDLTPQQLRQNIPLDTLIHPDNVNVSDIGITGVLAYQGINALLDYVKTLGAVNKGNTVTEAAADLSIKKLSGATTLPYINKNSDLQNPTTQSNAEQDPATFDRSRQDGVGGFTSTLAVSVIDPDFFDDGTGTLNTMTNNNWQVKRAIFFGQTDKIVVTYGQAEYTSKAEAIANIFDENPIINPLFDSGTFVTAIVVQEGATDLSDTATVEFVNIILQSSSSPVALSSRTIFSDYIIGSTSGPTTTATTSGTAVVIAEMTKTFTPTNATHKIEVGFSCSFSNTGDQTAIVGIFIDGALEAETEVREYANAGVFSGSIYTFWQGTHATSSMTITARMWTSSGTLTAIGVLRKMIVKEIRE